MRKSSNKGTSKWIHSDDALCRGHIVYNVKFLGHVEVDQPKGIEVVKDAIRKMKFNKHIKKSEGQKPPKVELSISTDSVAILDSKSKIIQHHYPLQRISYCADDKSDKRFFTFIAKHEEESIHHCYVFDSEKCAEEITLTIGQAFDLAYKRFVETSGKDIDARKQFLLLQKKVQELSLENIKLKEKIADLERINESNVKISTKNADDGTNGATVGRRLENLLIDDISVPNDTQTNDITSGPLPLLLPPPPVPPRTNIPYPQGFPQSSNTGDLLGGLSIENTQSTSKVDPFGMPSFNPNREYYENEMTNLDKQLMDMEDAFSKGIYFGHEDFSLDELDPLKKS